MYGKKNSEESLLTVGPAFEELTEAEENVDGGCFVSCLVSKLGSYGGGGSYSGGGGSYSGGGGSYSGGGGSYSGGGGSYSGGGGSYSGGGGSYSGGGGSYSGGGNYSSC